MKLSINVFITAFLAVLIVGGIVWADTNGVWHEASDIREGVFGANEGATYYRFISDVIFDDVVLFNNKVDFFDLLDANGNKITGAAPAVDDEDVPNWAQIRDHVDAMVADSDTSGETGGSTTTINNFGGSGWSFDEKFSSMFPVNVKSYQQNGCKHGYKNFLPLTVDNFVGFSKYECEPDCEYSVGGSATCYYDSYMRKAGVYMKIFDEDGAYKKHTFGGDSYTIDYSINRLSSGEVILSYNQWFGNYVDRKYSVYMITPDFEIIKLLENQTNDDPNYMLAFESGNYFYIKYNKGYSTKYYKFDKDGNQIEQTNTLDIPTYSQYKSFDGKFSMVVGGIGGSKIYYNDFTNDVPIEIEKDASGLPSGVSTNNIKPGRLGGGNILYGGEYVFDSSLNYKGKVKYEDPLRGSFVDPQSLGEFKIYNVLDNNRVFVYISERYYVYEIDLSTYKAEKVSEPILMSVPFERLEPRWILPLENAVFLIGETYDRELSSSDNYIYEQKVYAIKLVNP